ncbi:ATP-binding domain-containing protein [Sinomonas terrae]|uniref:ATP-binding domain-containing protein n=1 Tax=Sinomonas terrae TaxID=2908838 RepID=A0ABS9U3S4_9MICC|nr:ATP-binding domain-containing protein [Sinomonas terrae]MCH6471334.1 ATP-binding domain-containing protein [Sinomonas terrae]
MLDASSIEGALERMWPQLTPAQFVRELYGSRDRLIKANKGFDEGELDLLYRPMVARMADEPWTKADLAVVDLAQTLMRGVPQKYEHIVVDEAQDLSHMELLALRARSRSGSMTVVGDIAQSTGPHARDSWDSVEKALMMGLPSQETRLEHGYRVPRQAFNLALPVLAEAAPKVEAPLVLRDVDQEPIWTIVAEDQFSCAVAKAVIDRSKGYFVGVIAHPDRWEDLRIAFDQQGLKWAESSSGELSGAINLVAPEDAKGLEFDAVIVVDPQRIAEMPHGMRLLYIALTRTTTMLDIVIPEGNVPRLFQELIPPAALSRTAENEMDFHSPLVSEAQVEPPPLIDPFSIPMPAVPHALDGAISAAVALTAAVAPAGGPRPSEPFSSLPSNLQSIVEVWVKHYREELAQSVAPRLIPAVIERLYEEIATLPDKP